MITAAMTAADPALRGLEGRERGSACHTPCNPGCTVTCHERHSAAPAHDQYYCDQLRLGRDVTEYKPEVRREWSEFLASLPPVRVPADKGPREQAIAAHAEHLRRERAAARA